MAINVNTSNYINTQGTGTGNSSGVSGQVVAAVDGAVVTVKDASLKAGQTISGQITEIDGRDIKLLLSNNQTINARLEGNINALLGQTLSFEVKNTENGVTSLRPLYTNLNNSAAAQNALKDAGLPTTANYMKMVSAMMDQGMAVNKNALYSMARSVGNYPYADPETIVKLNKLGLPVNEVTINQYENYAGFERQIIGDVNTIASGLTDVMRESLSDIAGLNVGGAVTDGGESSSGKGLFSGMNFLSDFLSSFSGKETTAISGPDLILPAETPGETIEAETLAAETAARESIVISDDDFLPDSEFKVSQMIFDMIDETGNASQPDENTVSKLFTDRLRDITGSFMKEGADINKELAGRINSFDALKDGVKESDMTALLKSVIKDVAKSPDSFSEGAKLKLARLLTDSEFSKVLKDVLTKQMLIKPEEAVSSKNINEVYSRILQNTQNALNILQESGRDDSRIMNAAANINENVAFMNELNQVASYVQLPLLMNNKAAHGDLYVYKKKKNVVNDNGELTAFLHLDMDNLGPLDIYIKLSDGKKLNTHFYLKDEATIDFIAANIDRLNKRLVEKGYNTDINVTKQVKKGALNMADEFLKDDPDQQITRASKYSFDMRA